MAIFVISTWNAWMHGSCDMFLTFPKNTRCDYAVPFTVRVPVAPIVGVSVA